MRPDAPPLNPSLFTHSANVCGAQPILFALPSAASPTNINPRRCGIPQLTINETPGQYSNAPIVRESQSILSKLEAL